MPKKETHKPLYYNAESLTKISQLKRLGADYIHSMKLVTKILPFRVNSFVVEELIDWDRAPDDLIFKLTFPHKDLLSPRHYSLLEKSEQGDDREALRKIRAELNPHPSEQKKNVPVLDGKEVQGVQHKYDETILLFPAEGQTCHSYCTFCFRWPQFIGDKALKFETGKEKDHLKYIKQTKTINDVLITGGDPMVMSASRLRTYIEPFLKPDFDHIRTIRLGSKSLTYWPFRFISDKDTDEILQLFEEVVNSGKHLAFMAHFNHWQELENHYVREAIKNIQRTGAIIRSQTPILKNINDSSEVWIKLWKTQYQLGIVPYYMFVERNTGANHYFSLPLYDAYLIYSEALRQVSGLCRTVRGPSMSATPGKVNVNGVQELNGKKYFVLDFLQARNREWVNSPFLAKFDDRAVWLDQLKPAFTDKFFFED